MVNSLLSVVAKAEKKLLHSVVIFNVTSLVPPHTVQTVVHYLRGNGHSQVKPNLLRNSKNDPEQCFYFLMNFGII